MLYSKHAMFNIIKTTKNCIGPSFAKHSICNKQLHEDAQRLKERLTSMSRWILTIHWGGPKNQNKSFEENTP